MLHAVRALVHVPAAEDWLDVRKPVGLEVFALDQRCGEEGAPTLRMGRDWLG